MKLGVPDDWERTAKVVRETSRKVIGVISGQWRVDKESW